jgi:phytoene/squalene synthetase
LLALSVKAWQLCDLRVGTAARQEMLDDLREDLRDNLMGETSSDQFPALRDSIRRLEIPQQFPHDVVSAVDYCLRAGPFTSWDDWLQLGYRLGGGTMLSVCCVFHGSRSACQGPAIAFGQAVWLTRLLFTATRDVHSMQFFLPADEVAAAEIDLDRYQPGQPHPALIELVSSLASRIAALHHSARSLPGLLDLDGRRATVALHSLFDSCLHSVMDDPSLVFRATWDEATRRGRSRQRLRHLLGLGGAGH